MSIVQYHAKRFAREQLESAYIKIDKIFQNEIIFFIERNNNQTFNDVFGTVIRVKAGSNVGTSTHFPDKQIGEVSRLLGFTQSKSKRLVFNVTVSAVPIAIGIPCPQRRENKLKNTIYNCVFLVLQ